ncbi:MAG: GxxExxY protein [candidate division WOR-3 bacterium]|nr:GxxExxY protein [candidate division WOR-3 bacterium]
MLTKKFDSKRAPLTAKIISGCFQVHNALGPGFIERIYLNALKIILQNRKLTFQVEKEYTVVYNGVAVGKFRADLVAENKVIVEIKAIENKTPKIFESQIISYLKASGIKVGLLVNFGSRRCEIRRLMVS